MAKKPSMTLVALNRTPTLDEALASIDALRGQVESGEIIAFVAVGIDEFDECYGFSWAVRTVSNLRLEGAMARMSHQLQSGEF